MLCRAADYRDPKPTREMGWDVPYACTCIPHRPSRSHVRPLLSSVPKENEGFRHRPMPYLHIGDTVDTATNRTPSPLIQLRTPKQNVVDPCRWWWKSDIYRDHRPWGSPDHCKFDIRVQQGKHSVSWCDAAGIFAEGGPVNVMEVWSQLQVGRRSRFNERIFTQTERHFCALGYRPLTVRTISPHMHIFLRNPHRFWTRDVCVSCLIRNITSETFMSKGYHNIYATILILNSVQCVETMLMAALYKNVYIIIIIIILPQLSRRFIHSPKGIYDALKQNLAWLGHYFTPRRNGI